MSIQNRFEPRTKIKGGCKNMRKRLLSALLAMAMVLTMLPMSAFAAGTVEQPEGLADYKVIAAGVATTLPEGFPTENAGSGVTETENTERVYVQLNKPVPDGYTITLTVYPANEVKGAYMSSYVAPKDGKGPEGICFSVAKMAKWYWGDQEKGNATTLEEAFGDVKNLYFHVGIAKVNTETSMPDYESTEEGKYVFNPKNSIGKDNGAETADAPTLIEIDVKNPYEAPAKPAEPFFTTASDAAFAGKTANEVQTEDADGMKIEKNAEGKYVVTGVTLKEIASWPEFNQSIEAEQSGYYLAIAVPKTIGTGENEKTITSMQLPVEGGTSWKTIEPSAFTENNGTQCDVFIWMGATAEAVKAKSFTIKVKYGDASDYTDCVFDFSQVKVEGEEPVTYAITAAAGITNGTVTLPNPATAAAGTKVEFTVKPAANFEIDTVTVVKTEPAQGEDTPASQADELIVVKPGTPATDGTVTYSFTMPAYAVTVNATFKAKTTDEKTEKIASTGFEAVAADADKALGVESAPEVAAHCDPNTMWAKFEGLNAEKNYKLVVTKGGAEVYTEASFPGTATKVYFTLDPELVESKPAGHSIAKSAIAEGKYEFTLTEVVADAPAGQAETEEEPLEAKAELEICKVTFNANGATSGTAPAAIFASQNNDIALPDRGDLVKTGYAFTGWGVALNEDGKYIVKDTIELKAQWLNDNVTHVDAEVTTGTLEQTVADEVKKTTVDSSAMLTDPAVLAETDKLAEQIPQDTTDILTDEQKTEGGFVLKVAVYMEVAAKEYTPASDTNPNPVLKLEITPKSKLVAVKSVQGQPDKIEDVAEGKANAKPLPVTEFVNPVTINVVLPAGFATAGDNDIFAKHMGTTVQYIETTVTNGVDTLAGSVIATFEANEFSPYELTKDARKVAVTFKDAEGNVITEIGAAGVLNLSPVNISEDLPTVTAPDGYEFKGWAVAADKTKVVYNGKLTEEYLTEMSKTATLELFAVVTKSSGGSTGPAPGGIGGGSSGTTTYSVNVPTVSNGTVTVNPRNAAKDATVTITVSPNQGYHLESLTVTDKDGNTIELTKVDATKYTFKMPASRVEVKAVFAEGEAPAVSFTDVAEGEYYYDAVKWAVDKGVTNGLTETTFGPNASCTRAQMVTFLWRAAGSPEPTATTTAFTDIDANEYYYKAVLWAVEKGITTGTTETTFSPNATVTRAQTVTFLYRYAGSPAVSGSNNFTDLEAGEYYINAVQWAATNGITTGTTETTFSPANNCTRGQIVTFLYRHIVK